jgi:TDG/mug DNA glycosylase family protein
VILPDVIGANLRVVFCGTAAGDVSARASAYYAGPGNAFWSTLHEIGLTPVLLSPTEYPRLLDYGIGLTDLCKLRSGSDRALRSGGFDVAQLVSTIERYRPRMLAFNGKKAAQVALRGAVSYGLQPGRVGETPTFVLPSTSGAARGFWDVDQWHRLAAAVE